MDKYEEEMFNFLTIEDNLKGLIIAKNQFKNVRERLIKNFWKSVQNDLKANLKDPTRWEVKIDSNIFVQYSKLYLLDKSLVNKPDTHPLVFFCWEELSFDNPCYGLCTNTRLPDTDRKKVFDIVSHESSAFLNNELSSFKKSDLWPLYADVHQYDLSNDQTLLQIIPTKQEELAKQFSDQLINLFNLLQDIYERILMECESIKKVTV